MSRGIFPWADAPNPPCLQTRTPPGGYALTRGDGLSYDDPAEKIGENGGLNAPSRFA